MLLAVGADHAGYDLKELVVPWLRSVGHEVDDLGAELKRLESMGAKVLEGPNVSATGSKIAFIAAPDDVRIEVMQLS